MGYNVIASALKHGVGEADIGHALRCRWRVFASDDDSVVMVIGPSQSAEPLEVDVKFDKRGMTVIHAMPARAKFLAGWWLP